MLHLSKKESQQIATAAKNFRQLLEKLDSKYFDPDEGYPPAMYAKDYDQLSRLEQTINMWTL